MPIVLLKIALLSYKVKGSATSQRGEAELNFFLDLQILFYTTLRFAASLYVFAIILGPSNDFLLCRK